MKDLTKSAVDRQNILNNYHAIEKIQAYTGLTGLLYDGEYLFTSKMVADFFGVSTRTLKNILNDNEEEIKHNGYHVIKGQKLKDFKGLFGHLLTAHDDPSDKEIDIATHVTPVDSQAFKRIKSLAVFNFRAVLNIVMLLTESDKAKVLRGQILDLVLDSINEKLGGSAKYVNQRDEEYIVALAREPFYRKEFTSALTDYLDMGKYKYALYTDAIYRAIFKEDSKEYRAILKLEEKDNTRDTMYSEVLKLIASFEIGIADEMKSKFEELGRLLTPQELDKIIKEFAGKRHWAPQIEDACTKMASRDYSLRKVLHTRLEKYIVALSKDEYDKFLGEKSKSLLERFIENPDILDVFKRLKER